MGGMFSGATNAQPDMRRWNFSNATNFGGMFTGVALPTNLYSNFLVQLSESKGCTSTPGSCAANSLDGGDSKYNSLGAAARNILLANSWAITDGGADDVSSGVSIQLADAVTSGNHASYMVTGLCSTNGTSVSLTIADTDAETSDVTAAVNCSSGSFTTTGLNVAYLTNGTLTLTATHDGATDSTTVTKSAAIPLPMVAVSLPAAGSSTNLLSPTITGTGANSGATVSITTVGSASACSTTAAGNGSWSCALSPALTGGAAVSYTLSAIQSNGSTSSIAKTVTFTVDTQAPTVNHVTASTADGSYRNGTVSIQVVFSEAVNVTGTPALALNSGGSASYWSGTGTATLTFRYNLVAGQNSADLDYTSTSALTGGTLTDLAGNSATRTLATPGAANSLGANKNIVIDTTVPTISQVTSSSSNGSYKADAILPILVVFSESISVTGTPTLTLNTGGTASYVSGTGTSTLTFNYTVSAGQSSSDLNYSTTSALALAGGTINDMAGNAATRTLPGLTAAGSLGTNKNLVIDTTAPTVTLDSTTTEGAINSTSLVVTATTAESTNASTSLTASTLSLSGATVGTISWSTWGSGMRAIIPITITAASGQTVSIQVPAGVFTDTAGNPNTASSTKTWAFDNTAPLITLGTPSATYVKSGATSTITVTVDGATSPSLTGATSGTVFQSKASSRDWASIAMSADGTRLAAVVSSGNVWVSSDSGLTWASKGMQRSWSKIACSSTCQYIVASAATGYLYVSTDYGDTWTAVVTDLSRNWRGVAVSADGSRMAAAYQGWGAAYRNGAIYLSFDYGATWTASTSYGSRSGDTFQEVAMSANGHVLIAGSYGGGLYTSSNSGSSWTDRRNGISFNPTLQGIGSWNGVAMSSDGSKMLAINSSTVYQSTDSGSWWTALSAPGGGSWAGSLNQVASSSDGSILAVASNSLGGLYLSKNSGSSWTRVISSASISDVALSSDGVRNIAGATSDPGFIQISRPGVLVAYTGSASCTATVLNATTSTPSVRLSSCTGNGTATIQINSGVYQDAAGNLSALSSVSDPVTVDTTVPTVLGVNTATDPPVYLLAGNSLEIRVQFSESVTVTGAPTLLLNSRSGGATASLTSVSGAYLTFQYDVDVGDSSADLDTIAQNSLVLADGATIADAAGNAAVLTLPTPGAAGSLGANRNIIVDAVAPDLPSIGLIGASPGIDPTPSFSITASSFEPGATVYLVRDSAGACGSTTDAYAVSPILDGSETALSLTVASPLAADGTYDFYALVIDAVGNTTCVSTGASYRYEAPLIISDSRTLGAETNRVGIRVTTGRSVTITGDAQILHLEIDGGTVVLNSNYTFTSVAVTSGTLTAGAYSNDNDGTAWTSTPGAGNGKLLFTTGSLTIGATGRIHMDGKGYMGGSSGRTQGASTTGPGTNSGSNGDSQTSILANGGGGASIAHLLVGHARGGGGSYGSLGESGWLMLPLASLYGASDFRTEAYLGSGGGAGYNAGITQGGAGAGAISITASSVTIASGGNITANGQVGQHRAGSGSGGTIILNATALSNSGLIEARGGAASDIAAGGHGRIHIAESAIRSGGVVTLAGLGQGTRLSLESSGASPITSITISANSHVSLSITGSEPVGSMIIDSGSTLLLNTDTTFSNTVTVNGTLTTSPFNNLYTTDFTTGGSWNGPAPGAGNGKLLFTAESVVVGSSGVIHVDAMGYMGGGWAHWQGGSTTGPGTKTNGGWNRNGGGGGGDWAGNGGNASYGTIGTVPPSNWYGERGKPYGESDFVTELYLGSGGAASSNSDGGNGGGAIRIAASSLTISAGGRISSDGGNSSAAGSGGTIVLQVSALQNEGTIRARGGFGAYGFPAGDGRIHIPLSALQSGSNLTVSGVQNGFVVSLPENETIGTITASSSSSAPSLIGLKLGAGASIQNLAISGGSTVRLNSETTFSSVSITSGTLTADPFDNFTNNSITGAEGDGWPVFTNAPAVGNGRLKFATGTLALGDSGVISMDGKGYSGGGYGGSGSSFEGYATQGAGLNTRMAVWVAGNASYGTLGSTRVASTYTQTAGSTYGESDFVSALYLGSGGAGNYSRGRFGGGAISIDATTLTMQSGSLITARGEDGAMDGGYGSGGTLVLLADNATLPSMAQITVAKRGTETDFGGDGRKAVAFLSCSGTGCATLDPPSTQLLSAIGKSEQGGTYSYSWNSNTSTYVLSCSGYENTTTAPHQCRALGDCGDGSHLYAGSCQSHASLLAQFNLFETGGEYTWTGSGFTCPGIEDSMGAYSTCSSSTSKITVSDSSATRTEESSGHIQSLSVSVTSPATFPDTTSISGVYSKISSGRGRTCGIHSNGDLYCWGFGPTGSGSSNSTLPGFVGSGYASVAAGFYHACGIQTSGALYCWGYSNSGQLGRGNLTNQYGPAIVNSGTSYTMVAAGDEHTCAITTGGELKCWGLNSSGQVGNGGTSNVLSPYSLGTGFASVAAGTSHTCAIKSAGGELFCWGSNSYGQIGTGNTTAQSTPNSIGTGYSSVDVGFGHTCAIKSTNQELLCWGWNSSGQLGVGDQTDRSLAVSVGTGYALVTTGSSHTCAIKDDGTTQCWGYNGSGQLGLGDTSARSSPTSLALDSTHISAGYAHTCAILSGSLSCWGYNLYGELGYGNTLNRSLYSIANSGSCSVLATTGDLSGTPTCACNGESCSLRYSVGTYTLGSAGILYSVTDGTGTYSDAGVFSITVEDMVDSLTASDTQTTYANRYSSYNQPTLDVTASGHVTIPFTGDGVGSGSCTVTSFDSNYITQASCYCSGSQCNLNYDVGWNPGDTLLYYSVTDETGSYSDSGSVTITIN
jgi:alpha-tubulin suppressor-like RCC1 family protein